MFTSLSPGDSQPIAVKRFIAFGGGVAEERMRRIHVFVSENGTAAIW